MKYPALFILSLFVAAASPAQVMFQKTFGGTALDYAYDMQKTSDGGYVMGGIRMSPPTTYGTSFVVKTNANGDTLWTSYFGDTCGQYVNDIVQTYDGGYLSCGGKFMCGNIPLAGGDIVRLDQNGNVLWCKYCSGGAEDPYPCMQAQDGNFIVGGYLMGIGAGAQDACMMKLNANGDTMWSRTYGGTGDEWFYHILQTPDGGYLGAGKTTTYGQGGKDIYLVKTNAGGGLMWSKAYGTAQDEYAFGHCMVATTDGGYILTGQQGTGTGPKGIFLLKINSLGAVQWAKQYDGAWGHGVKQTADKGYAVIGRTVSADAVLIKTDSLGNVQWSKTYGGSNTESGWLLDLANDGGYAIGGWTTSFTGSEDMYFIKTDANGNSGCNNASGNITTVNYPVVTVNANTQVGIGPKTVSFPYQFRRGATVTNLCSTVGEEEGPGPDPGVSIFPNPSEGRFSVSGAVLRLDVFDVFGRLVYSSGGPNGPVELDLSSRPKGVYLCRGISGGGLFTRKLIVR